MGSGHHGSLRGIAMSSSEGITQALAIVEFSAAQLERIGYSHDQEFRRLLCELALNLRLIAGFLQAVSEASVFSDNAAA
jgi:hypothetical protein